MTSCSLPGPKISSMNGRGAKQPNACEIIPKNQSKTVTRMTRWMIPSLALAPLATEDYKLKILIVLVPNSGLTLLPPMPNTKVKTFLKISEIRFRSLHTDQLRPRRGLETPIHRGAQSHHFRSPKTASWQLVQPGSILYMDSKIQPFPHYKIQGPRVP